MQKICGLLVLCVVLAGCDPVKYEVKDNQIQVTGASGEDIARIVQNMFNTYHWNGTGVSHSSQTYTFGSRKTTEMVRKLWAVTDEWLPFSVEIVEKNNEPVLVTIHTDPKSKYTTQAIIAELLVEINAEGVAVSSNNYPTIRIRNLVLDSGAASYRGNWTSEGDWKSLIPVITIYIEKDGKQFIQHTLDRKSIMGLTDNTDKAGQLPLDFTITRPAGKMEFTGNREAVSSPASGGSVVLQIDARYLQRIQPCVKEDISDEQLLSLFFSSLDADYAEQVVKAMGEKQTLSDLLRMRNYQIDLSLIKEVYDAGYKLGTDQLIRVKNYQLSPKFMAEFKEAGYNFNIDELIRIKNYQLNAEAFKTFKDAGYDFSIDEQIKAKNYQVSPSFAARLKKMGCNYTLDELIRLKNYQLSAEYIEGFKKLDCNYSIDELIRLKNFQITPDYVEAFQKIGYSLSIEDMIKARNFQVHPDDLKKYADAGYKFTLDEVIKLRNYSVPMDFILGIRQEGYENFSADEISRFRQRNISVEDIRKIRSEKKNT